MSSTPVIAILDIGKTNKKFFLFDESYKMVTEENVVLAETKDEDGDPCEDLELLNHWISEVISESARTGEYEIRAINFSAYGASFVHLGRQGEPVTPLYSYLKPFPKNLSKQFYETYGGEITFPLQTASPILGSLNAGMQLYRIKNEKPDLFREIKYSLHLPQYLSWFITGRAWSEMSSIGCHSSLWNFSQSDYHAWVYRESIIDKLPPIQASDTVYPIYSGTQNSVLPEACVAGIGLHDSSAAMIPYLETFRDPFVLISTGTWCISMNPFNNDPLTFEELQRDCLCYLSYRGEQIKASRLFAGYEHDVQVERLSLYFQKDKNYYRTIRYKPGVVTHLENSESGISNDIFSVGKPFGFIQRDITMYSDFEEAYHRLMMDIMIQQIASTRLIMGNDLNQIFVDGGFSKNDIYMHLLARGFPSVEVYAATIAQASALGAAMVIHSQCNARPLPSELISLRRYKSIRV